MKSADFIHTASDGKSIHVSLWSPDGKTKAMLLVAHGLAEHGARYGRLAETLCASGWLVCAPDHRGHGATATEDELGWFAERDGFARVADDLGEIAAGLKAERPSIPIFLLGHSMGSLIAEAFCGKYGGTIAGCALSGVVDLPDPGTLTLLGLLAAMGSLFKGSKAKAPLINSLTMGANNGAFHPNRTPFDWLSRDQAEVDKYVADPRCGFVSTDGLFRDFASGFRIVYGGKGRLASFPKSLPLYIFAGAEDPVGGAKGFVGKLGDRLHAIGLDDIETKLYPGARHEVLNETNRDEVTADLLAWLEAKFALAKRS